MHYHVKMNCTSCVPLCPLLYVACTMSMCYFLFSIMDLAVHTHSTPHTNMPHASSRQCLWMSEQFLNGTSYLRCNNFSMMLQLVLSAIKGRIRIKSSNNQRTVKNYTHTHPFNGPLSRTTQVSQYQKGDSEWQWHQLGHMQVCTLLQADNHASTPLLSFLLAGCPSCHPTNSVKAPKAVKTI